MVVWTNTPVLVWGLTMAAYKVKAPLNDLAFQSTVFAFGATLLHSTACVINDICDVDFDRQLGRCCVVRSLEPTLISVCHPQSVPKIDPWLPVESLCWVLGYFSLR